MSASSESQQRAIDFAKNYPLVQSDSMFTGPVTVGNIGHYNDRAIVNLCIRTLKSHPKNATISFPMSWSKATQFKPGDQVNVRIENGYVRKLWAAKPEPVRSHQPVESKEPSDTVTVDSPPAKSDEESSKPF